jgi:hypothetical protein
MVAGSSSERLGAPKKTGHINNSNTALPPAAPWDTDDEHPLAIEWRVRMRALRPDSPLDRKAREAALTYVDGYWSISATASRLGVKRETALRRLERAERNGWVALGAAPEKMGHKSRSRVCRWRVWWDAPFPGGAMAPEEETQPTELAA